MDIDDLTRLVTKISSPILLVLSPIGFCILIYDIFYNTTTDKLSEKQAAVAFIFCVLTLYLAIYGCRKELGWFAKKN